MTQNFVRYSPDVEHRDAMNTETSQRRRNRLPAIQVAAVLTALALATTGITVTHSSALF